jgi:hypothetical protein
MDNSTFIRRAVGEEVLDIWRTQSGLKEVGLNLYYSARHILRGGVVGGLVGAGVGYLTGHNVAEYSLKGAGIGAVADFALFYMRQHLCERFHNNPEFKPALDNLLENPV